ncbi:tRNA-binding protein [Taibaiella koreensis]|nr:tRNA-binding protein [Taibaiella koreensis]
MAKGYFRASYFSGMETISWNDFEKVELRVGTVIDVFEFPKARKPAYKMKIDFGPYGIRMSSAQITRHYTPETLLGRQVVAVINFPEKQIADFMSQCLVTGFADENGDIVLTAVERTVPNGTKIA